MSDKFQPLFTESAKSLEVQTTFISRRRDLHVDAPHYHSIPNWPSSTRPRRGRRSCLAFLPALSRWRRIKYGLRVIIKMDCGDKWLPGPPGAASQQRWH